MIKKSVLTLFLFIAGIAVSLAGNGYTLVIDAGHGGHDTGAKGAYSYEKDINLKVALAFGKYVEDNCKDVNVIYTRKTDVFIPLKTRANIANKNNADLFVSVHTNALPNGRIARGFEVYTLGMHRAKDNLDVAMRENSVIEEEDNYKQTYQGFDPKSSESYIMFEFMQSANMRRSVELAKLIENSACKTADRVNMGIHQAGFLVLRETSMPSCLIELGFITTPDEEDFLNTDDGIDKLANGIYKAFLEYKNRYPVDSATKGQPAPQAKEDSTKNIDLTTSAPAKKARQTSPDQPSSKAAISKSQPKADKPESVKPKTVEKKVPAAKKVEVAKKADTAKKPEADKKQQNTAKAPATKKVDKPKEQPKADQPVFKVQIFAVARQIPAGDPLLKGHTDVSNYNEKGSSLTKYTIGSSTDFNAIVELKNSLRADFPQAYIVAFKNGQPTNLSEAINEYKKNKRKQSRK